MLTPTVSTLSPMCTDAGAGQTFTAGHSTGVASFNTLVYTGTLNAEGNLFFAPPAGRPIGLTHVGFDLWATDPLRDRLLHFDTAAAHVFLPLIEK